MMISLTTAGDILPRSRRTAPVMGILMDNELLLLGARIQGKRVLRSLQLPSEVSEPGGLLEDLWDVGSTRPG